jgi:hypothetical protein
MGLAVGGSDRLRTWRFMCAGKSHTRLREKGGFNQSQTSESYYTVRAFARWRNTRNSSTRGTGKVMSGVFEPQSTCGEI